MEDFSLFPVFYAGPISYYKALANADIIVFDIHEHFTKQTYRNRMHIYGANGVVKLTIPVHKIASKTPMKDLLISYDEDWQRVHWRALVSAYQSSPFFEYYDYLLAPLYEKQFNYLLDLNFELHSTTLKFLNINLDSTKSIDFMTDATANYRNKFSSKKQSKEALNQPAYQQVFSYDQPFIPDLSVLDLLFNLGSEAGRYLSTLPL